MNRKKCIILDFEKVEVRVISIDSTQTEDIEEILTDRYDYNLGNIQYMVADEFILKVE